MAATTGFYLHPYFCFQKHANFDYGFTFGFNVGPVAAVTAVAEVLHRLHVSAVLAVAHVPVTATATAANVVVVTGVFKVLEIAHIPAVLAIPTIDPVQQDLHGIFQQQFPNWNSQIWITMSKSSVFKKNSPQQQILHQNPGQGYTALFQIISHQHPTLGQHPHLLICSLPMQLFDEAVTKYSQYYNNFVNTRAFLEENQNSLDTSSELDKFLSGLTHSTKSFLISREERLSNDPNIKRKFTQGVGVNTINECLSELHLDNGPKYSSRSQYDDSVSDSDSNAPSRPLSSRFSGLRGSARILSLT